MEHITSIDQVCEVFWVQGPEARSDDPPHAVIELPHGATLLSHLEATKIHASQYPGSEYDLLFLANTDQGSPEYGVHLARLLTSPEVWAETPLAETARAWCAQARILVIRSLLPRTLVDVNRVWASAEEALAAGLTRGVPAFITDEKDLASLESLFQAYHQTVSKALAWCCGNGGFAFILHTYAPISVSPIADEDIVTTLKRAYTPEFYPTYPVRPLVELITTPPGEACLCDEDLSRDVIAAYAEIGLDARRDEPFDMHQATMGYIYAKTYPNQTLCLEVSRAELADPYDPFVEMNISPEKVARMTRPIAWAYLQHLARNNKAT